jgi:hypothetical protein
MAITGAHRGSLNNLPEAVIYDAQLDQIVVITRNKRHHTVRSTLQFDDASASALYHMLGAALQDMDVVRRAKTRAQNA